MRVAIVYITQALKKLEASVPGKLWIVVLLICLPVFTASGAEETDQNSNPFTIKSIEIKGSKTMPPETILGILQTRIGEEVSLKKIRDDVKELFKLGQFSNIQVDSTGTQEGINLTFVVEEWSKISGDITVSGNKELSTSKIKDSLTIGSGRSLSGRLLQENKNKILSMYRDKGYYLAQVEPNVVPNPDGTVGVSFNIDEGKKIVVEEIDIIGNRRLSDRDIKKQMKIKKDKRFDDTYFEGDIETILDYYRQNGFINARIVKSEKEFNKDRTGLIIRVEVEEGGQFRTGKVKAEITPNEGEKPIFSEEQILKEFTLKEGDVYSEASFEEGIARIQKVYLDRGRVSARITPGRDFKAEEEIVDISFSISEGGPAYIEGVPINWISDTSDEPHKTKEYVIRRELDRFDIKKGRVFSYQNIEDARRKILTLGPFIKRAQPRLALEQNSEGSERNVTVNFDVEESRQSGMFSIAGGYGSEGGLFGALDIWDDNVFGRAWRMQLRGEIGTRERRTGLINFSTPWIFNTPTSLSLSLYSRRRSTSYYPGEEEKEETLYKDESVGASITIGRPLTKKLDLSVGLRDENVSYKELMAEDVWKQTYKGKTRSIKLLLDRDTRNYLTSMFDPNSGSYNNVSAEYSGFGGDKFQKYIAESSLFVPTWWKLVLVFHLQTGYITGESIRKLRLERFYLGGIDSVRGYEPYSITPSGGYEKYGGNQMMQFNAEYRFPITDMLRGIIFFDAGQTWADNEQPWKNFKPRKSIGIGIRLDLLGALARFEYGFPLDPAKEGEKVKGGSLQWSIGPAF